MLSIILGAVAAAGSIVGGAVKSHNSRVAAQRQQAELDRQKAENEAIYKRRYYEDVTMRADNQRIINQARAALPVRRGPGRCWSFRIRPLQS